MRGTGPIVAALVGIVSGVYIFQPLVLEQLKKDGTLKPQYNEEEREVRERLGDLTNPNIPAKNPEYYQSKPKVDSEKK